MKKQTHLIIAAAVSALFATAALADDTHASSEANVKCSGANACKGQSACKGANNACKGQNSCKGQGWEMVHTEKDCTDKGGSVVK